MSSKKKRNKKVRPCEKNKGTDSRVIKRFIMHYFILMAVFVFLKDSEFIQNIIDINGLYSESIVFFTSKALGLMGVSSTYHGSIIQLPSISFDIKFGCNGLEAVMIYAIGVIAFPGDWKNKFMGIAAGLIILQIINLIRIISLAWSGVYYKAIFETMHIYVSPGIMIAISLFIKNFRV
ncbi:MAG: archaeosortase/exosortase family protein [Candidatus Marinimicrobia bacterium]|nr:archaeosortase/exosortase family protein [Candidatus Neomarinimicrobiota bacterium]